MTACMITVWLLLGLFCATSSAHLCNTQKPLRVGLLNSTTLPFYPLNYADAYGNSRGFDPALATNLLDRMGIDTANPDEFQAVFLTTLDDRLTALEDGRVDMVVADFTVTPERSQRISFVKPFYYGAGVILAASKNSDRPEIYSWEDILTPPKQ